MRAVPTIAALAVFALSSGVAGVEVRFPEGSVSRNPLPQNQPSIAVDPRHPLNLVVAAHDYRIGHTETGVYASYDGGRSWKGGVLTDLHPLLRRYDEQVDPSVAALRDGVFFYGFLDRNFSDARSRIVVARSDDGGFTWPRHAVPVDHTTANSRYEEDELRLAVDDGGGAFDGYVYLACVRVSNRVGEDPRIVFSRSTDGGASFGALQPVSAAGNVSSPLPVVGPQGQVYVVWRRNDLIQLDVSLDGGATFGPDRSVVASTPPPSPPPGALFPVPSLPALAVDRSAQASRGTLYLAWSDANGAGQGVDVLLSRSSDGGSTWSAPLRVSDDSNRSHQFFPALVVGNDGVVSVVFLDQRDTPGTPLYHAYLAQSFDGGLTFRPNTRLSSEPSDSRLADFGGAFIGTHIGIVAAPQVIYPVWTDVRASLGNAEIFGRLLRVRRP